MKSELIRNYFKLMHEVQVSRYSGMSELNASVLTLSMLRIDLALYSRYGYDVSITRKLN